MGSFFRDDLGHLVKPNLLSSPCSVPSSTESQNPNCYLIQSMRMTWPQYLLQYYTISTLLSFSSIVSVSSPKSLSFLSLSQNPNAIFVKHPWQPLSPATPVLFYLPPNPSPQEYPPTTFASQLLRGVLGLGSSDPDVFPNTHPHFRIKRFEL